MTNTASVSLSEIQQLLEIVIKQIKQSRGGQDLVSLDHDAFMYIMGRGIYDFGTPEPQIGLSTVSEAFDSLRSLTYEDFAVPFPHRLGYLAQIIRAVEQQLVDEQE